MERLAVLQRHLLPQSTFTNEETVFLITSPCSATAPRGVVLVGGMVMDLQASPTTAADIRRGGSVPGRVTQTPGGVARNVGESLALLCKSAAARPPLLISAVGDDLAGQALVSRWQSLGLSTEGIVRLVGASTPSVAVMFDRSGEVAACVADMELLETALTPAVLHRHGPALAAAAVVMVDGNLAPAVIQEACARATAAGVPVWFEPVSPSKSVRATAVLHLLTYISPNEAELVAMAEAVRNQQGSKSGQWQRSDPLCCCGGRNSEGAESGANCLGPCLCLERGCCMAPPSAAAAAAGGGKGHDLPPDVAGALEPLTPHIATMLESGVKHIVLTLGPLGAVLCTLHPCDPRAALLQHLPALPARVANCSGAGDCVVAGCLFGLAQGRSMLQALACGVAASGSAVESQHNVPPGLSQALVDDGAAKVLRGASSAVIRL